jgi:twitching motility protein PilT
MAFDVDTYLKRLVRDGVSDVHFKVHRAPLLRINGSLYTVDLPPLTPEDTAQIARHVVGETMWPAFESSHEIDTSYSVHGFGRFRVSAFYQRGSISLVLRFVPYTIPSLDELGVPPIVKEIAMQQRGLILVTGATGSGKSSTLAAMIEHINQNRACHIITVEDPIEFLHRDNLALINQREVSIDTFDFDKAFRAALRQDPDIILVGELRDRETMETALRAAETGHLVMSTLHTTDAKETVHRFIDFFPPHQQTQIRIQLASNLRAVISQRLVEKADGTGRALAAELLRATAAIKTYITNPSKEEEILQLMERGRDQHGMQTFDQALSDLLQKGVITQQEAVQNATSPNDFQLRMTIA